MKGDRRYAPLRLGLWLGLLLVGTALSAEQARDEGSVLAKRCASCHGALGLTEQPHMPNIGGMGREYLSTQLHLYRSGQRVHPQMSVVAQRLSDRDIEVLSEWFAAIKVTAHTGE